MKNYLQDRRVFTMSRKLLIALVGVSMFLAGCGQNDKSNETPDSDYQRRLIERLIDLQTSNFAVRSKSEHQISISASWAEAI